MALPGVSVITENGGLGRTVSTEDNIIGLICTGVAIAAGGGVTGIALYQAVQLFSLTDAETHGLKTDATAPANQAAWAQVRDFYREAGEGAELWLMLKAATDTQASILDQASANSAKKLIDASLGRIRVLLSSNWQAAGYVPTLNGEIDDDARSAVARGHELATFYAGQHKPLRVIVDGRDFTGNVGGLNILRQQTYNKSAVCLASTGGKNAAMGLLAGRIARIPVQRNIGRVEDGAVLDSGATLTNGAALSTLSDAQLGTAHDRGYIIFRRHVRKGGFFFNDDPMCTPLTDDFFSLANGRVMDKASILAHDTYLENLLAEVPVNEDGTLSATLVKTWQQQIEDALKIQMTQKGEISGATCYIDAKQNILATDELEAILKVRPVGTVRQMKVRLGFNNPASA